MVGSSADRNKGLLPSWPNSGMPAEPMKRPLLLTGFMATGKSTVGRRIAERTGRPFFDTDELIQERSGSTVVQLFAERGEAGFRALEREILQELLNQRGHEAPVVALGGGALLDRTFRVEVLGRAVVVTLGASPAEIVRRLSAEPGAKEKRPLLADADPPARVAELLSMRQSGYQESHGVLTGDGQTPDELAEQALAIWRRDAVAVAAGATSYSVVIGSHLMERELGRLLGRPSGALLVSDTVVEPLHGGPALAALSGLGNRTSTVLLSPGEQYKTLDGLRPIFQGAAGMGLDRQGLLVGLGGGVVTDMTGFAAASWMRGVRWIGIPTTLLAMVDASVGGKTAVDFEEAKNAVGAFWQPSGVICDVSVLATESERMFRGALSEVIKTALIGDASLLDLIEEQRAALLRRNPDLLAEVVNRCIRVKARIVSLDERERGLRATLNLGHTIGHALESAGGFAALTHGEAVALGLVAALRLGQRLDRTPAELTARVTRLLVELGLPHRLERSALERATSLLRLDKKRARDSVKFVFAENVGQVTTTSVSLSDLARWTPELADAAS